MAKSKQDYAAEATIDAQFGTMRRQPNAGWQLAAYNEAWANETTRMTGIKDVLPEYKVTARTGTQGNPASSGVSRKQRRANALVAGIAAKHALNKAAHSLSLRRF